MEVNKAICYKLNSYIKLVWRLGNAFPKRQICLGNVFWMPAAVGGGRNGGGGSFGLYSSAVGLLRCLVD